MTCYHDLLERTNFTGDAIKKYICFFRQKKYMFSATTIYIGIDSSLFCRKGRDLPFQHV
jgi:hypothetical protein